MAATAASCMDEETVTQKSDLSNPCARRDSLPCIFRLPTEILEIIFIHRARDYYSKHSGDPTPRAPSWVNVSYVCRHWRNIALNCSTLWTYLFVTSPRWTEELLTRSKQAPLKLHVNPDPSCCDLDCDIACLQSCVLEQVMNHVERIQEFRLQLPLTYSDDHFFSKLSLAPRSHSPKASTEGTPSDWTSVLFNRGTPTLHTLELTSCPMPWYSFDLSGLTTLSLNDVPVLFQQNTIELLDTLGRLQNLKYLYLDNALASASAFLSGSAFHTSRGFSLPYLSRLSIVAPLSAVIALLSCVNIPSKTEVRLECLFESDSSRDDYTALSSLLAQRFSVPKDQTPPTPTIRSLGIASAERGRGILTFSGSKCAFNSSISISHVEWGCDIPLQVVIHFRPSMAQCDGDHIMGDICRSLPLTKVQSVHVLHPPLSSAFWKVALGHLRDLRCLKLSHGWMPDLASVLSFTPCGGAENEDGHAGCGPDLVFAPALEELELRDILFATSTPDDRESLYGALSGRTGSQGRLTLTHCGVAAKNGRHTSLDMVGRWEDGQFHVVESV